MDATQTCLGNDWCGDGSTIQNPNFLAIDLSGASGTYITVSKNGGEYVTYDMTSPSFDQNEFENTFMFGQSTEGLAFLSYPDALVDYIGSDTTKGILAINESELVVYPPGDENGFVPENIAVGTAYVLPAPYDLGEQVNTLSVKATPNVDASADIFNTLVNPNNESVISFTSNYVIYLA